MPVYPEFEIGIHKWPGSNNYAVEFRYTEPGKNIDVRSVEDEGKAREFNDPKKLEPPILPGDERYGQILTECLFSTESSRQKFREARTLAEQSKTPLRITLFISPNALELLDLCWETLCDPDRGTRLTLGGIYAFSRYITAPDYRPVSEKAEPNFKALIVIANPSNLGDQSSSYTRDKAPLDVALELDIARQGLGNIQKTELATRGEVTLENIIAQLNAANERDEGYDILYLVCHGGIISKMPWLWLEDSDGKLERVPGIAFIDHIQRLSHLPRLIVLASCQSGGAGDERFSEEEGSSALSALGPKLALAGVPAVVAMQGKIRMNTCRAFMRSFFENLQSRDPSMFGQVDRAIGEARYTVRSEKDCWMPLLYLRLRSGSLWYQGVSRRASFTEWRQVVARISQRTNWTPVLGLGLLNSLIGPPREMVHRWAETHSYPRSPQAWEDLPSIAQYLTSIWDDPLTVRKELHRYFRHEIEARHKGYISKEDLARSAEQFGDDESEITRKLNELIAAVGVHLRKNNYYDPHAVLADLSCPIYITASPDNLLYEAIKAIHREPHSIPAVWNNAIDPDKYLHAIAEKPTPEKPLIYHLLGQLSLPASLVLTQDNYFDYLMGLRELNEIPSYIKDALVDTSLIFLGFDVEDWNFRLMFRVLRNLAGDYWNKKEKFHVAVQIDPARGGFSDPERAERYLERYLDQGDVHVYWGSTEDFIRELSDQPQVRAIRSRPAPPP